MTSVPFFMLSRLSVTAALAISIVATYGAGRLDAQIRVHPTGVNVNTQGATTTFLTFGGLRDQVAVEAFWCGELVSAAPSRGFQCDPNTIFGRLPIRYDLSSASDGAFTDIMSIPPSVARRAYQEAQRGRTSSFFYVRRFVSTTGAPDEYVAVTCRLAGGGARVPFALTDVTVTFDVETPVLFVAPGGSLPPVTADIAYNGTGRLRGRWEVVLPGEELPAPSDLLTEATLPPDERGTQRRYTQLSRFNVFLPPPGKVSLPGPDVSRIPTNAEGTYLILLRIEATDDKEGDADFGAAGAGNGVAHNGAVAGFPMPTLRYVVGAGSSEMSRPRASRALRLLLPRDAALATPDSGLALSWLEEWNAALYRVELQAADGTALFSAVVPPGVGVYRVPPFVVAQAVTGSPLHWRVTALDFNGWAMRHSGWRTVRLAAPNVIPSVPRDSVSAGRDSVGRLLR
ncbi:MAG: hypothetical protein K0S86_219 [Geminicoccaceae bacterium]|nr:hypothetical protein [Geminicoccaceae bacterium]